MSPQGAPDPECVLRPSQEFPRFCLSFPLLGNPNPPGRQGCMWPHYFTLALHGITDDWGECRRLESTAGGEFWCGEQTPPGPQIVYGLFVYFCLTIEKLTILEYPGTQFISYPFQSGGDLGAKYV